MAQTNKHTSGHRDSLTESAQWGRFSENHKREKEDRGKGDYGKIGNRSVYHVLYMVYLLYELVKQKFMT